MPDAEIADAELVSAFVGGNAAAMDELVRRYRRPLFSWFVARVGDRATAEDLYQDTWLKVMRGAAGFHDVSFRAWMWRIARNRLIDHRRKMTPDLVLDVPALGADADADAPAAVDRLSDARPDVRERMEDEERRAALRAAIAGLSDIHRQIVHLRIVEAMPFKDIAAKLGISLNTALGRMHDAVKRLKERLDG